MSTEAMKLALEALKTCTPQDTSTSHVIYAWHDEKLVNKAIKALEEALAKQTLIQRAEEAFEASQQQKRPQNCGTGYCSCIECVMNEQKQGEPVQVDQTTVELAESVGLIGPASRSDDLHAAIQRFHDLICVNATIKAARMAADAISAATTPQQRKPLTDEQREQIAKEWRGRNWTLGDIIDAVEAAHKIKG